MSKLFNSLTLKKEMKWSFATAATYACIKRVMELLQYRMVPGYAELVL